MDFSIHLPVRYMYVTCTLHVHVFVSLHREGIGFYRKLQGSVSRLKKRAEEVCDARQRERHSMERLI